MMKQFLFRVIYSLKKVHRLVLYIKGCGASTIVKHFGALLLRHEKNIRFPVFVFGRVGLCPNHRF